MALARADLESLLRTHKLDRTLTTALPGPPSLRASPLSDGSRAPRRDAADDDLVLPTGLDALDVRLDGGLPRGHLSELVGPRSSGRMSVLLRLVASATARGELVAIVDALDMLDVASLEAAGAALDRVLWIRGHVVVNPGLCRDLNQRAMEQAIRALSLVLQAGNFGVVALDVGEAPIDAIRRLPFTTWLRLQRMIEGSPTVCVLVGSAPMARSSAGLTIRLGGADPGAPEAVGADVSVRRATSGRARRPVGQGRFGACVFQGLDVEGRVVRARSHALEGAALRVALTADAHV
jgi:hypothetical protein